MGAPRPSTFSLRAPNAAPPVTVTSVEVLDDETADWTFSEAPYSVQDFSPFEINASGPSSWVLLTNGKVRATYAGAVMGFGDPWSVSPGGWLLFPSGTTFAGGSGTTI